MQLTKAQRNVISNIFRDLTKLTVVALVIGQFVPERHFNPLVFLGGLGAAFFMAVVAVRAAVNIKEVDL